MQNLELPDARERELALDPTRSYIVQAPAGSGKTELLTQRYLILLSCVKQPEEILAITFTKKSAAEMRMRIVQAIKNANDHPEPDSPHERKTWLLARNVLQKNAAAGWNLLSNPNRLQIQTIDSFNAYLSRQLPLLSNLGAPLEIVDDATPLYRAAVQEFLSHLEEELPWAESIAKLLIHMDNDLDRIEKLLISMLAKRDQWLPYIAANSENPDLRKNLELHLKNVVTDCLSTLKKAFPATLITDFVELATFSAQNLVRQQSTLPIVACAELTELPGTSVTDKSLWLGLASLFLTKSKPYNWRKSFTVSDGFPAPSNAKNTEEKKQLTQIKQRLKNLMENLTAHEELYLGLRELIQLPEHAYADPQWETLSALHDVLRIAVAQLKVTFQQYGQIDYIENAHAAYTALGHDDTPTDLTLALDYKIQHILIDEFQDTSNGQYRLLHRLITGWEAGDGRTLFVVGDPMQSIYRFREAEVGLFMHARKQGIRQLTLHPLTLKVNFRSTGTIVDWVNNKFSRVFPTIENISNGAVTYAASIAHQAHASATSVCLHSFVDADEIAQAERIVKIIQTSKQQFPTEKIAILVRSRNHLHAILPALKTAHISFRAMDIEPLTTRPVIQDLLALTRALVSLMDRIAWLAILRAPWCGLTLSDILLIAHDRNKSIIWEQLQSPTILASLSANGQKALERILPSLTLALAERRRYGLRAWIEYTWLLLGGPATVSQKTDLEDAAAYFNLLDQLEQAGDLSDLARLTNAVNKLYATPDAAADNTLQIMTIHNSKGLEFDTVILPHLEKRASQDDKQLLQWMERPRGEQRDLILAPIHAVGEEQNLIYDYIRRQHEQKLDYENSRLLYVAVTRAKKHLHICFNLNTKESDATEIKEPTNNSLLQKLWPAISADVKSDLTKTSSMQVQDCSQPLPLLKRLTTEWQNPLSENLFKEMSGSHQQKIGFNLPQNNAKLTGIIIHQILQEIAVHGIAWWQEEKSSAHVNYIIQQLLKLGMLEQDAHLATPLVIKAIANTLTDPKGLWILAPHEAAQSELPLTWVMDGKAKQLVIDRTFIFEGMRWIIDYKSTENSDADLESFLLAQQQTYSDQLWEYSQALCHLGDHPIRVGLYFPLIPAWREW